MCAEERMIADRLDDLRETLGLDRKAFWREIVAESTNNDGEKVYGWSKEEEPAKPRVSYNTVLNYLDEREPPGYFLARVCQVFGVREEWLLTGKGPRDRSHREVRGEALHEAIAEAYPERYNLLPSIAQDLFRRVLMKRLRAAPDASEWVQGKAWDSPGEVPEGVVEYAGDLLQLLFYDVWKEAGPDGVVASWGVDPRQMHPDRLERFARSRLNTLEEIIPGPGDIDPWDTATAHRPRRDRTRGEEES